MLPGPYESVLTPDVLTQLAELPPEASAIGPLDTAELPDRPVLATARGR
jgi:hypothetical protein